MSWAVIFFVVLDVKSVALLLSIRQKRSNVAQYLRWTDSIFQILLIPKNQKTFQEPTRPKTISKNAIICEQYHMTEEEIPVLEQKE